MKIKVDKNGKTFGEVDYGQMFKYTFCNAERYFMKYCSFDGEAYGVDLSTGEVLKINPTDYVVVFPNAMVLIDGVENENKMDKTT